jgi:hypothetical protein
MVHPEPTGGTVDLLKKQQKISVKLSAWNTGVGIAASLPRSLHAWVPGICFEDTSLKTSNEEHAASIPEIFAKHNKQGRRSASLPSVCRARWGSIFCVV